jgi:hypothetical protein
LPPYTGHEQASISRIDHHGDRLRRIAFWSRALETSVLHPEKAPPATDGAFSGF